MDNKEVESRKKAVGTFYVDIYPFVQVDGILKTLILKRRADVVMPNTWQHISGKIQVGEKISQAFFRQVIKKTGQKAKAMFKVDFVNIFYDQYYDTVMMVPVAIAELADQKIEIDESLHEDYLWVGLDEAKTYFEWQNQKKSIDLMSTLLSADTNQQELHRIDLEDITST